MSSCPIERSLSLPEPDWSALVRTASPLLFALAQRNRAQDPEEFTFRVLRRALTERGCWVRSGLPARVWLCGLALQMARAAHPPRVAGPAAS
ncbi:hypothetical protein [Deinococcus sedimenti]|uniref:Uncharacterized protein n=1 Tax=Deinococcus sedimenti TaxID=1867090 RepID=A0ABQ2RYL1_9DEIO|nr:hypothetical protein [Deinococcus sedimenti]GGR80176.1 hypothetical protein GCM10008960_03810 [Deinococcus sedimenti]